MADHALGYRKPRNAQGEENFIENLRQIRAEAEQAKMRVRNQYAEKLKSYGIEPDGAETADAPKVTTQAEIQPPAGAIQMLIAHPNTAALFDAKYGPGSSAKILGQ